MTEFSRLGRSFTSIAAANANANITAFLRSARKHLAMEIGFVGEFTRGQRVFRYVDSDGDAGLMLGQGDPLEETYCQRVVDGRLPELIINPADYRAAAELPVTDALGIGSLVSVPIKMKDGSVYGTFCCFSHVKHPHLKQDDLDAVHMFADMVAGELEGVLRKRVLQVEQGERIETVLRDGQLALHYQPVYRLWQQEISGFECLARFPEPPHKRTDVWFAEADEVGLGTALELAAIRQGLAAMQRLPGGFDVHVNASPGLVMSGVLDEALLDANLARLVLEVTEHEPVADYEAFLGMLTPLRRRGLRLAVDDAGAGHATLRHILKLRPDIIKLDISLIRNIDEDKYKSALAAALIRFALETEVEIVAEGIETVGEFNHLRALGAQGGQGNYLGRPVTLAQALTLVCESDAGVAAV